MAAARLAIASACAGLRPLAISFLYTSCTSAGQLAMVAADWAPDVGALAAFLPPPIVVTLGPSLDVAAEVDGSDPDSSSAASCAAIACTVVIGAADGGGAAIRVC